MVCGGANECVDEVNQFRCNCTAPGWSGGGVNRLCSGEVHCVAWCARFRGYPRACFPEHLCSQPAHPPAGPPHTHPFARGSMFLCSNRGTVFCTSTPCPQPDPMMNRIQNKGLETIRYSTLQTSMNARMSIAEDYPCVPLRTMAPTTALVRAAGRMSGSTNLARVCVCDGVR